MGILSSTVGSPQYVSTSSDPASFNKPPSEIDAAIAQIASYGGAISALLLLLLIIRASTKFIQAVKKDD
jgi:hypothetical protein